MLSEIIDEADPIDHALRGPDGGTENAGVENTGVNCMEHQTKIILRKS